MCYHELWPTSVSHPFSILSQYLFSFTGGKHYQKITIPIFKLFLQNFAIQGNFPYILSIAIFSPYFLQVGLLLQYVALFQSWNYLSIKNHYTPASMKLKGGYTGFTSVCPSFCPSVDRIVFALYLQQYSSDPFHICTSYQATSVCVSRVMFLAATKQLYKWYFPFVHLSVRPSVCLSHLFDYVPNIVSSWNFQELLPMTKVRSMQKVKVRGQRSRSQRSQPNLTVSGL